MPVLLPNRQTTGWLVEEVPHLRGYTIEWIDPDQIILSRGNELFRADAPDSRLKSIGTFPAPFWKRTISKSRMGQRALRFMFYNVMPIGDEIFATFGKSLGVFRDGNFCSIEGIVRPFRVLRSACAIDQHGDVYFGEYLQNRERHEIHIYRYSIGKIEIAHTFQPGEVRHVHGIYFDPHEECHWCLTGDRADECRLLKSDDGFRTHEVVGQGDETWRAVSARFTPDSVYYGMDAEFETNHIFRWDKSQGQRVDLGSVDGPIYYSTSVGDHHFFGVSAEPCPSQTSGTATLWHVSPDDELSPVISIKKDWLNHYFMMGTLHFPAGPGMANRLYFHAVALQNADQRTFCVEQSSTKPYADKKTAPAEMRPVLSGFQNSIQV